MDEFSSDDKSSLADSLTREACAPPRIIICDQEIDEPKEVDPSRLEYLTVKNNKVSQNLYLVTIFKKHTNLK